MHVKAADSAADVILLDREDRWPADQLAAASPRLCCLVFGIADYSTSIQMLLHSVSGHGDSEEPYPGDASHYVYSRLIMCCKTAGLKLIDVP
jgi:citrate lyase beta subunit